MNLFRSDKGRREEDVSRDDRRLKTGFLKFLKTIIIIIVRKNFTNKPSVS